MKKLMANGRWQMENISYYLLILFLPTQLGKHFWPDFSYVHGLRIDYLSPTVYLTDVIVGLLLTVWFIGKLGEKTARSSKVKSQKSKLQFRIKNHKHLLLWLLASGYLLSVILFSNRIIGGLYSLFKFLEISFVGYYTAKFISDKLRFKKIIILLCASSIFESLLAVFQFLNHGSLGGLFYYLGERTFNSTTPGIANATLNGELVLRPYGTLPHPNVLAGFLVVVMILALFMSAENKSRKVLSSKYKVLRGFTLVIGSIGLFLTMSRVAILIWVLICAYYLVVVLKKRMVTYVGALILIVFMLSPLGARFLSTNTREEAIVQREELNTAAVKMIKASPLLGVGIGNFIPTLAEQQKALTVGTYLQPVHNIFLLVAAETGLIGLLLFVCFLWKTFQRIKMQEVRIKEMFYVLFFIIFITGLFDHYWLTLQQGQLLFSIFIGLCWKDYRSSEMS